MLNILKTLAVGIGTIIVADIITKRALKKAEESADKIIERALDRVEESADQIVSDAINLAVDRLEAETGLPVTRRNRHPRLDALIRRLGRKRAT